MNNLEVINYGSKILKLNNIDSYNLDSELLLAKVLNTTRENLLINLENDIKLNIFNNFLKLLDRRIKKEPIAYIFNKKEFWKYKFKVNKDVLIPRPETEIIVNETLKLTNAKSRKNFLDVGTGSGCIILSILKERSNCKGTAIDISKKALKVAISNAKMHHLENKIKFVNIDIDKFKDNKYDFIVSNPPYINEINLKRLDKNVVCYEPLQALRAGKDGLNTIKKLIFKSKKLLRKNGKLIFEIGEKQKYMITELLLKNRFYINKIRNDLKCYPRVIISTNLS